MPINWDILLHELETGKCILCIGADVFSPSDENRIEKKLAATLQAQSDALGIRVYDDGWFHYLKERDELATWFTIKKFYENQLPLTTEAFFHGIAALPFHLILNFTPDYRLRDAYNATGKPFEFACLYKNPELDKSRTKENIEPTKDKPLIFNMLGEIEDKDSLVMTYDDMFGYMEAIFEKKRMPQNVKLKIQQATHFIFLGVPLDKWYFHLFMRVLNMHRDTSKTKRFGATYTVNEKNATFCEEQYTLTFVQEDISHFTDLLNAKWGELQALKTGGQEFSIFDQWRNSIKSSVSLAIKQVFKDMKPYLVKQSELVNTSLLMEMQWNGFISSVFETEMAKNAMKTQIINGILNLIDDIEKFEVTS
jgi:SIR2-like domain